MASSAHNFITLNFVALILEPNPTHLAFHSFGAGESEPASVCGVMVRRTAAGRLDKRLQTQAILVCSYSPESATIQACSYFNKYHTCKFVT